jgi:hypothetical protein
MKIVVVSSRATLFLKLILPTLWFSIMGALLFFSLWYGVSGSGLMLLILGFLGVVGLWAALFRQLKWIGLNPENLYVSNYFKNFKYTYDSISGIEEQHLGPFRRITLHFHQPGQFGQKVHFLASYNWYYFLQQHPEILKQLLQVEAKP